MPRIGIRTLSSLPPSLSAGLVGRRRKADRRSLRSDTAGSMGGLIEGLRKTWSMRLIVDL
jgi:hypothetical protein